MTARARLWYFADPMCSWCWGFAPVVRALRAAYRDRLDVTLVLGGLRPGTTAALAADARTEILHHWRAVHARTGQPFRFEGALPEGFIYDTEPASRAVVAAGALRPQGMLDFFETVQEAFYAAGRDVTREDVLAALAADQGIGTCEFIERFRSPSARDETGRHFELARRAGVNGFPTTALEDESGVALLASGYRPLAELAPLVEARLAPAPAGGGAR